MKNYNTIKEVFNILNQNNTFYLVLRNYENLFEPEVYLNGHGDVDLLCADSQEIVRLLDAQTIRKDQPPFIGDGVHYHIFVAGEKVSLDLRYVGDDYYCEEWEKDLLETRVWNNGFYIMDEVNYFYTLVYHAILQKVSLSDEYFHRLLKMAELLNISLSQKSEMGLIRSLEAYMDRNNYWFTYPLDYLVPARFNIVNKQLIRMNRHRWFRHKRHWNKMRIMDFLVFVKHSLIKEKKKNQKRG